MLPTVPEIETKILERLSPLKNEGVTVELFADSDLERSFPKFRILVGESRETFSAPTRGNRDAPLTQTRTASFEIVIHCKDLRSHREIRPLCDRVLGLLGGFRPYNALDCLYPVASGFAGYDANRSLWTYSQTYEIQLPYTQSIQRGF